MPHARWLRARYAKSQGLRRRGRRRRIEARRARRLRAQIDAINLKLVRPARPSARKSPRRSDISSRPSGAPIYQPARERAVIDRVTAQNRGPLIGEHLRRIFAEIISACTRARTSAARSRYLGPEHTYSHEAAREAFRPSAEFAPQPSFAAVFQALDTGAPISAWCRSRIRPKARLALTLDLLIDTPLVIIGEILLPIRHALMSRAGDAARDYGASCRISSRSANAATISRPTFRIASWKRWPRTRWRRSARRTSPTRAAIASERGGGAVWA